MQLTEQDIDNLISIGKNEAKFEDSLLKYFKSRDFINRQLPSTWLEFTNKLTEKDLIFVFKALVRLEKELKWVGGSCAGAIWIFNEFHRRKIDKDLLLQQADFGLRNSDNPYVPFGSAYYGIRTLEDYVAYRETWLKERSRKAYEDEKL